MTAEWEPHEVDSQYRHEAAAARSRAWAWVGGIATGIAILMVAFAAGAQWLEASRWDPLGEYPLQTVFSGDTLPQSVNPPTGSVDPSDTVGLPTFYLDDEINVFGVKCVKPDDGTVNVAGSLSWVSDQPPGRIIEVDRGGGPRGPGCVSRTYSNSIPDEVRVEIDRLTARGIFESDWHLSGTETPVKDDGTVGVDRTWVSTTFRIIHTEAP